MNVKDLGEIDGDMLLFGGPYSNLQATEALLIEAAHRGIDAAHMVCTGDLVAYCGDPAATVDLIMDAGIAVVAGNCKKQLAAGALDCGCGFESGTTCDLLSAGWYAHANSEVSAEHRNFMAQCPDFVIFLNLENGSPLSTVARPISLVSSGPRRLKRFSPKKSTPSASRSERSMW